MASAHESLTLQLLEWITQAPHTYAETIETWKSTCPRLSIWEDACASGLVDCAAGAQGEVFLTEKGRRLLARAGMASPAGAGA